MTSIRPEDELLILIASVCQECRRAERIQQPIERGLNWDGLLESARHHGLLPLLYWQLSLACPASIPDAILERVQKQFHEIQGTNLLLASELLEILSLLEFHGVPAIPFKGPTLALLAYENLAFRQFGDLDLLLHERDLPRAKTLLSERGYQPAYRLAATQQEAYLRSLGQWPLVKDNGFLYLELHSRLTPRDLPFPVEFDGLSQRLRPVRLCGRDVLTFSPEDLLLLLSIHGAKHLWMNLGWICDLARLLALQRQLDWDHVVYQARKTSCYRLLLLGLFLANDLLRAPLPKELHHQLENTPVVKVLARKIYQWLLADPNGGPDGFSAALFHLRTRERLREGLRYSLSLALAPTLADWTMLSIPARLSFLYYPLRMYRLTGKYGLETLRG